MERLALSVLMVYLPFSDWLAGKWGGWVHGFGTSSLLAWALMEGLRDLRERKEDVPSLTLPILLFGILGAISIFRGLFYGPDYLGPAFLKYYRSWVIPFLLYFLVFYTVNQRETIRNMVSLIIAVISGVGLLAIYSYYTGEGSLKEGRVGGMAGDPNILAAFFNYYLFLPFGFFLLNLRRLRGWSFLAPFAILLRGIMVTFSRGGYLAFFAALHVVTFFRNKIFYLVLLAATCTMLANPVLLPAGIRYRLGETIENPGESFQSLNTVERSLDPSSRFRISIWKGALSMIREHPVWGTGYNLFEQKIQHYWSEAVAIDAHNTFLLIAAEIGIPALLVFLWILGLVGWNTHRLYRNTSDSLAKGLALGFLGGQAGFLMSNLYVNELNSPAISGYFWILAALVEKLLRMKTSHD